MKFNKIFLVGFRTTGKSTLGKIIADKLNWSFIDTDFLITSEFGESADIITKNGSDWKKFRESENETLKEVIQMQNAVVACGGGVGVNDVIYENGKTYGDLNKETLKNSKDSLVVLLTSTEEKIKERL